MLDRLASERAPTVGRASHTAKRHDVAASYSDSLLTFQATLGNAATRALLQRRREANGAANTHQVSPTRITGQDTDDVTARIQADEREHAKAAFRQPGRELEEVTLRAEILAAEYHWHIAQYRALLGDPNRIKDSRVPTEEAARIRVLSSEVALEEILADKTAYQADRLNALAKWLRDLQTAVGEMARALDAANPGSERPTLAELREALVKLGSAIVDLRKNVQSRYDAAQEIPEMGEMVGNAIELALLEPVLTILEYAGPGRKAEIRQLRQKLRIFPYRSKQQEDSALLEGVFVGAIQGLVIETLVAIRAAGGIRVLLGMATEAEGAAPEIVRLGALLGEPDKLEAALQEIDRAGEELLRSARTAKPDQVRTIIKHVQRGREFTGRLRAQQAEYRSGRAAVETGGARPSVSARKIPMAILPNGREIPPTDFIGGFHGTGEAITVEEAIREGLQARGGDWRLLEHAQKGTEAFMPEVGDSAFRGTTPFPSSIGASGVAGQGAADWAGEGGLVFEVRQIPTWRLEQALEGQIRDPLGLFDRQLLMKGELEGAIPARVPPECIVRIGRVSVGRNGQLVIKDGDWILNPNYRPPQWY